MGLIKRIQALLIISFFSYIWIGAGFLKADDNRGVVLSGLVVYADLPYGYNASGTVPKSNPYGLATNVLTLAQRDDGAWIAEVRVVRPPGHQLYGKTELAYIGYDRTNHYEFHYTEAIIRVSRNGPEISGLVPLNQRTNIGYISDLDFPITRLVNDFTPEVQATPQVLWLAYCLGKHGKTGWEPRLRAKSMPLPWFNTSILMIAHGYRLDYVLNESDRLLREIRFVRDFNLDLGSIELEAERPELVEPDESIAGMWENDYLAKMKEWTNGALAGMWKGITYTNWNSRLLPVESEATAYNPIIATKDGLMWRYHISVTNLAELPPGQSFVPPILSPVNVYDLRFKGRVAQKQIDTVEYRLNPGDSVPKKDSPKLIELYQKTLAEKPNRYVPKFGRKIDVRWVILAVALASSIPLYYFQKRIKKA